MAAGADLDHRDREVLLCRAAGLTRAQLIAHPERCLPPGVLVTLTDWAARRRSGEPVAYIVGEKEFWGLRFQVSPAVLVPRPETELLVEVALETVGELCGSGLPAAKAPESRPGGRSHTEVPRPCRVLELGAGSGAVAIALAREAEARGLDVEITATDVSAEALAVAERNGRRHGARVRWRQGDWFAAACGRYHLIVSNPPYIREDDPHLPDLRHEPRLALTAGADGLAAIRAIGAGARQHLQPRGVLAVEHGHDQAAEVAAIFRVAGLEQVETRRDLGGRGRVTRGYWIATGRSLPHTLSEGR